MKSIDEIIDDVLRRETGGLGVMRLPGVDGSRQRAFNRPAVTEAKLERSSPNAYALGPLGQRPSLTIESQDKARPPVSRLFQFRRPAHIASFIVAIVVDALEGVPLRRRRAHISQERLEGRRPPITHHDSTAAIERVVVRLLIEAPTFGFRPCRVFARLLPADSGAVRQRAFPRDLRLKTSAALLPAVAESYPVGSGLTAAVAAASPPSEVSWRVRGSRQHHQTPVSLSRPVDGLPRHALIIVPILHVAVGCHATIR